MVIIAAGVMASCYGLLMQMCGRKQSAFPIYVFLAGLLTIAAGFFCI